MRITNNDLAKWLHENYEQIAKVKKWNTQEITKVSFDELPIENKETMLELAKRLQTTFGICKETIIENEVKNLVSTVQSMYFNEKTPSDLRVNETIDKYTNLFKELLRA